MLRVPHAQEEQVTKLKCESQLTIGINMERFNNYKLKPEG